MKNPWKKLSRKEIYENPWIKVSEDQVINPNGGHGIYGLIHFKNKAIGIIPIDDAGNTYLVGQYRYALNEYSWEIPMGGGPLEENSLAAAKRELLEETGLVAQEWQFYMELRTSNSVTDEKGYIYLARTLHQREPQFDETEDLKIKKLPLSEVFKMLDNGEITDAISVAGLLKLRLEYVNP